MNLVLLTFWTLLAAVTRRRSKHSAPQPSPHIPSASASAAGSEEVKHTLELWSGINSKCHRSHFLKKPCAVTSCRCFSHMTAYWPMWLSRLTTLLLTWWGRGRTCIIVQRNCLIYRELITIEERHGFDTDWSLDFLGPVGILQCVESVVVHLGRRTDVGNHHRTTVAAQGVFEYPCQLAVSVRYKGLLFLQPDRKPYVGPPNETVADIYVPSFIGCSLKWLIKYENLLWVLIIWQMTTSDKHDINQNKGM